MGLGSCFGYCIAHRKTLCNRHSLRSRMDVSSRKLDHEFVPAGTEEHLLDQRIHFLACAREPICVDGTGVRKLREGCLNGAVGLGLQDCAILMKDNRIALARPTVEQVEEILLGDCSFFFC